MSTPSHGGIWPFLSRHGLLIAMLASLAILAFAFFLEYVMGMEPCPLCWLQRGVFMALAGVAVLGMLLSKVHAARWPLVALFSAVALVGIGIAMRHIYIKMNPEAASCGMDVETLLAFMPLGQAIMQMLQGSADCATAADVLGIPLPVWTTIGYLLVPFFAISQLLGSSPAKA